MRLNYKATHHLKEIFYITAVWVVIAMAYIYAKFDDIPDRVLAEIYPHQSALTKQWLYEITFMISLTIGLSLGTLHTFFYSRLARSKSMLFNIVLRAFAIFVLSVLALIIITNIYRRNPEHILADLSEMAQSNFVINTFISIVITENFIGFFILLRRNLGSKFLLNMIINTYRNPKEEDRVFMFLDMADSTLTAKDMGHSKFSRYIQDCFYDLSDIVLEHHGEIYQFVGDEAVITWKVSPSFNYSKCIDLFFSYQRHLYKNKGRYRQHYGHQPVFRAALHKGLVSTALVGDYKKEIAYHGDVLNLCARLQAACSTNNANLLVSEEFFDSCQGCEAYISEPVLLRELKGINTLCKALFLRERTPSTDTPVGVTI